jgi:hypothetical protein
MMVQRSTDIPTGLMTIILRSGYTLIFDAHYGYSIL